MATVKHLYVRSALKAQLAALQRWIDDCDDEASLSALSVSIDLVTPVRNEFSVIQIARGPSQAGGRHLWPVFTWIDRYAAGVGVRLWEDLLRDHPAASEALVELAPVLRVGSAVTRSKYLLLRDVLSALGVTSNPRTLENQVRAWKSDTQKRR